MRDMMERAEQQCQELAQQLEESDMHNYQTVEFAYCMEQAKGLATLLSSTLGEVKRQMEAEGY